MKEADAAQASNLGQVLAPAIAGEVRGADPEALRKRAAHRATRHRRRRRGWRRPTHGADVGRHARAAVDVVPAVAGGVLGTTVVLDDQLVQSDDTRMDWFRGAARRKGARVSDHRVHLPARRLSGSECNRPEREGSSQGSWTVVSSERSILRVPSSADSFFPHRCHSPNARRFESMSRAAPWRRRDESTRRSRCTNMAWRRHGHAFHIQAAQDPVSKAEAAGGCRANQAIDDRAMGTLVVTGFQPVFTLTVPGTACRRPFHF